MGTMASQITSLTIVYSTVYSGADQRKHQSSASLAFVRGIHRWPVNSPHKWPVTRKMFPFDDVIMPRPSVANFVCEPITTNWHSLRIAQHRINSNYFVLVRCHIRISSRANTNVLKYSKYSYWPCESKPIRIASYCIAERRINSCQFLLVRISSLYIRIASLCIRTGIRRLPAATQYVAIRCAKIALSYWIAHVRIGSCKFLLVPIVFSSHHSAIVLILHHHRTASYCIVSPSCCILLHRINSCFIRVWFSLIRK